MFEIYGTIFAIVAYSIYNSMLTKVCDNICIMMIKSLSCKKLGISHRVN